MPDQMSLSEATTLAMVTLKQVMEEKLNATNVEVMTIVPGGTFQMLSKQKLDEEIEKLN